LLCAVLLGFAKAEIGVSIMHDANHGAYSHSTTLNAIMGATLDVAGASRRAAAPRPAAPPPSCHRSLHNSFMWRQQHVVGHHAFTNVEGLDPDIRVSAKDVRRVTGAQPWHPWHAAQHLYLGFLYSLLAFKSIYVDDFSSYAAGMIGSVRLAKLTASEAAVLWGGKLFYAAYMLAVPLALSHHRLGALLALWAAADATSAHSRSAPPFRTHAAVLQPAGCSPLCSRWRMWWTRCPTRRRTRRGRWPAAGRRCSWRRRQTFATAQPSGRT